MAKTRCTHYWFVDSEDIGVCKYCGEVRDFRKLQDKERRHLAKKESGAEMTKLKLKLKEKLIDHREVTPRQERQTARM